MFAVKTSVKFHCTPEFRAKTSKVRIREPCIWRTLASLSHIVTGESIHVGHTSTRFANSPTITWEVHAIRALLYVMTIIWRNQDSTEMAFYNFYKLFKRIFAWRCKNHHHQQQHLNRNDVGVGGMKFRVKCTRSPVTLIHITLQSYFNFVY